MMLFLSLLLVVLMLNLSSVLAWAPSHRPRALLSSRAIRPRTLRLLCTPTDTAPEAPPSGGLKALLSQDMRAAMKNKEKARLNAIRNILTAIKQKEVDDRQDQT